MNYKGFIRNFKRTNVLIVFMLIFSLVLPCASPIFQTVKVAQAATVKISKTKLTLYVGNKSTLNISGTTKDVVWKSSNKSIASVSSKGVISAVKKGTATIIATVNKQNYKCVVTVKNPYILPEKVELEEGNTQLLSIKGIDKVIKWSSNDKSIVTIDSDGEITAKKAGTAEITATVDNKKYIRQITVVRLSTDDASIQDEDYGTEGQANTVIARGTLLYEDDIIRMEYVALENSSISTEKEQKLELYVKITNKSLYDYILYGESITINGEGTTDFLSTNKIPAGTTSTESIWVTYEYSNIDYSNVSSVSGSCRLSASSKVFNGSYYHYFDFGKADTSKVESDSNDAATTDIKFDSLIYGMLLNEEKMLEMKSSSNYDPKNVIWESKDKGVVTVSSDGKVKAVGYGMTYITICDKSGTVINACQVYVVKDNADKPSIGTLLSPDTNSRCSIVVFQLENKGSKTLKLLSEGARMRDNSHESFDRDLKLVDIELYMKNGTIKYLDYLDIQPNTSVMVGLPVDGKDTWYDSKTTIFFELYYDDRYYFATTSAGGSISVSDYYEYAQNGNFKVK